MSDAPTVVAGGAPGVAVVVPCHNLGRTVVEAVDSALAQTRLPAEIVVVDDGSTDAGTQRVLRSLQRPRTRVIPLAHAGVAAARNHGARATAAPYIVFLDADDLLAPDYIEKTARRLDEDASLSFVSCAVQAFEGASYLWKPPGCDALTTLTHGSVHVSSLMRRSMWDAVGGFDAALEAYEDLDFWLRGIRLGYRGEILDEPLLRYRVRPDSRYRRGVEPSTYLAVMRAIIEKHRDFITFAGVDVLASKERFLEGVLEYGRGLRERHAEAERELGRLEAEIAAARAALRLGRPGGLILAYHRVASLEPDTHRLCVPPERFRAHVKYLRDTCTPIGLEELVQRAQQETLPDRAVAVTLDDGYLDALTAAAPILVAHGVPATFFVNSDRLDDAHEAWHDCVERILISAAALPAELVLPVSRRTLRLETDTFAKRREALMALHGAMLPMSAEEREEAIDRLAAWSGVAMSPRPERRVLLGSEVRELSRLPGCRIGSHSARHLLLTGHPPPVQRAEVRECKAALEAATGLPVRAFCYPFGEHDASLAELVRATPFDLAVTVEAGLVTRWSDPMRLPRVEIGNCTADELAAVVDRAFEGSAGQAGPG